MSRKLWVIVIVAVILIIAGLPAITATLNRLGVIPFAIAIRAEYFTGTSITVIIALLVLLPSAYRVSLSIRSARCLVCGELIRYGGRYCPTCGSWI